MTDQERAIAAAHENWLTAIRTRPAEAEAWKAEYQRLVSISQASDWATRPTYSSWVHDNTGAETPIEQIGVYATFVGGILYAGRSWVKSHHLMRAAQLPIGSKQRDIHQALGWLTDAEIKNASIVANRFRARGIVAGIGFPMLWLAYIRNKKQ